MTGSSLMQISFLNMQRVWKLHPFGRLTGDGISPSQRIRFGFKASSSSDITGIADSSIWVYG